MKTLNDIACNTFPSLFTQELVEEILIWNYPKDNLKKFIPLFPFLFT
jgi:hypothetical protein